MYCGGDEQVTLLSQYLRSLVTPTFFITRGFLSNLITFKSSPALNKKSNKRTEDNEAIIFLDYF